MSLTDLCVVLDVLVQVSSEMKSNYELKKILQAHLTPRGCDAIDAFIASYMRCRSRLPVELRDRLGEIILNYRQIWRYDWTLDNVIQCLSDGNNILIDKACAKWPIIDIFRPYLNLERENTCRNLTKDDIICIIDCFYRFFARIEKNRNLRTILFSQYIRQDITDAMDRIIDWFIENRSLSKDVSIALDKLLAKFIDARLAYMKDTEEQELTNLLSSALRIFNQL